MSSAQLEAAIFDVDGTLIDSVDFHAQAWQRALREFGHGPPYQEVRNQIGKGGDQFKPVFLTAEQIRDYGEQLGDRKQQIFMSDYVGELRVFPKVRELLEKVRATGAKVALASSANNEELTRYKQLLKVDDLLNVETNGDEVQQSKPHPDVFHIALQKLGNLESDHAIVIGDTPYDAEAAGKAGLRTIGLLCGGFDPEWLTRAGCIALYRDPADLLERFDESPLAS